MADVATKVVFAPLEGSFKGQPIVLEGRSLPYRGASGGSIAYEITQRVNTVWYQGSSDGVQQVLGATYPPTTFNGGWKQRYLPEGQVRALVDAFTEITRTGASVRVTWDRFIRVGVITRFKWVPGVPTGGADDIAWEVEVEWRGVRASPPPTNSPRVVSMMDRIVEVAGALFDVVLAVEVLIDSVGSIAALARKVFEPEKTRFNDLTDNLAHNIDIATTAAERSARQVTSQIATDIAESTLSLSSDGQKTSGQTLFQIADANHGIYEDSDGYRAVINGRIQRSNVVDVCVTALDRAFEARQAAESQLRPDLFIEVVPNPGTDLRALAVRFYGNADLWRAIAKVNYLTESKIPENLDLIHVPLYSSRVVMEEVSS